MRGRKEKIRGYYRCNISGHKHHTLEERCRPQYVSVEPIEKAVWDFVVEVLTGDQFETSLREAQVQELALLGPKHEELERIKRLISECEREAANLVSNISKMTSPLLTKVVEDQLQMLEKKHTALSIAKAETEAALNAAGPTEDGVAVAMRFRAEVWRGLQNPIVEDKRKCLRLLGAKIVALPSKITVSLLLPKATREIAIEISENQPNQAQKATRASSKTSLLPSPPYTRIRQR